ncbi:MAG: glutaredoxin family protein [Candidatus Nanohalobium sp.]
MTEIEVFTTPTCPYCAKVKQWLEENNYEYTEINVAEDQEEARRMIMRTGQRGVPQTFVGDQEIIGFQPGKIKEAIEEEGSEASTSEKEAA